MEKTGRWEQLEKWDQEKVPCLLVYRLPSGKVVEEKTIIRMIVKQNKNMFILTESGAPIQLDLLVHVQPLKK